MMAIQKTLYFRDMRIVNDSFKVLKNLSMGMSSDYLVAMLQKTHATYVKNRIKYFWSIDT